MLIRSFCNWASSSKSGSEFFREKSARQTNGPTVRISAQSAALAVWLPARKSGSTPEKPKFRKLTRDIPEYLKSYYFTLAESLSKTIRNMRQGQ